MRLIERIKEKHFKDKCPNCNKLKNIGAITCSLECAANNPNYIDWDNIDLLEELKNKTIVQIAEELNCSDSAVRKRLNKIISGNGKNKNRNHPSIIKNCFACDQEIKVYFSHNAERNFCSRKCRDAILYNEGWPSNKELLKLKKT